jgi:hypothetical protein
VLGAAYRSSLLFYIQYRVPYMYMAGYKRKTAMQGVLPQGVLPQALAQVQEEVSGFC